MLPTPTKLCAALLVLLVVGDARGVESGIAVAPFQALDVDPNTAVILTGVAEGIAMGAGGRFVAHGELLRRVDSSDEPGCRTEECLARGAAAIGADLLLTGEVGKLEDTFVVKVQLSGCPDAETRATVSRQCTSCSEGALPALLEDALLHALHTLEPAAEPQHLGEDGRTFVIGQRAAEGSFHYKDSHRTLSRTSVVVDGVELSSLTRPGDGIGCLEPGTPLSLTATLLVHNRLPTPTSIEGTFEVVAFASSEDSPLAVRQIPVRFDLGGAQDEDGGGDEIVRAEVEVPPPPGSPAVLHIRTAWEGEPLEELVTRPVGRVATMEEVYLSLGEARVRDLAWGQEMQAHVRLFKFDTDAPAEVTVRMEREIRYWFDTDSTQAFFDVPEGTDGSYHLILPFTPSLVRRESTEGYGFEVWVNGCRLHRTGLYQ